MSQIEIDRLTLQVPGLPADQGHRLAEMMAAGLSRVRWAGAKPADQLSVPVTASAGASLEQLAASIVDALRRQMAEGG